MSDTMQTPPTPASVFQAHFGAPPGAQDPRADCEKWERLCGELLAERAKLRVPNWNEHVSWNSAKVTSPPKPWKSSTPRWTT